MKIAPVADIKAHLSSYLDQVESGPVIITRNGRPVAALVAITGEDELERLVMAHTPRLRQLLDEAAERIKQRDGIPTRSVLVAGGRRVGRLVVASERG